MYHAYFEAISQFSILNSFAFFCGISYNTSNCIDEGWKITNAYYQKPRILESRGILKLLFYLVYVFGALLPDAEYHIWILICRITELLFNTGRNGFSDQDSEPLSHFIAKQNILTEEVQGRKSCVVSLHHLMHIVDDIEEVSTVFF